MSIKTKTAAINESLQSVGLYCSSSVLGTVDAVGEASEGQIGPLVLQLPQRLPAVAAVRLGVRQLANRHGDVVHGQPKKPNKIKRIDERGHIKNRKKIQFRQLLRKVLK